MILNGLVVTAVEIAVGVVFVVWVLATIVLSTPIMPDYGISALGSVVALIPRYNFFAPNPGTDDYYVVYRNRSADGSVTEWTIPEDVYDPPDRLRWIWNPYYIPSKVVFDATQALAQSVEFDDEEADDLDEVAAPNSTEQVVPVNSVETQLNVYYLTILEFVTSQEHESGAEEVQFAVMQGSRSTSEYRPTFVSRFHSLS